MDNWTPCPRCHSNKVQPLSKGAIFIILLASGSLCIWLGFLFPPIWLGVLLMPLSIFSFFLPKTNKCKDCGYSWKPNKHKELHS